LAAKARPYNLIVTNVPGPQIPLYLQGALMQTAYPVVPLFENLALVVGLFSYNGGVLSGRHGALAQPPHLHALARAPDRTCEALPEAACTAAPQVATGARI